MSTSCEFFSIFIIYDFDSSGAGIYSPQLNMNLSVPLGKIATISQSEIIGILNCDLGYGSINPDHNPIFIFSDSQSSLKALGRFKFTSALTVDCYNSLQRLAAHHSVTVCWVPGHAGIEGNEKADELARNGSGSPFIGPEPCVPIAPSTQHLTMKRWKANCFEKHWQSLSTARQARQSILINKNNARYYLSLTRSNLKRLTEILTGHNRLNKHYHTIGLSDSPNCNNCGDLETSEHFLCKCPAYIMQRARFLGRYILPYNHIRNLPPVAILHFINSTKRI